LARAQYATGVPPIVSNHKQLVFDLEPDTGLYIDSMGRVSKPEDILSQDFVPMASVPFRKKIPRRLSEVSFYYRFRIQNPDTGMARLYLYPGMYHSDMDLFYLNDTGLVREKDLKPREGFVSLQIPSGMNREYVLCLTLTRSDNNTLSARLIRPSYLDDYVRQLTTYAYNRKVVGFVTCGVLIMMLAFCILNYVSSRKPEYFYNALFSIFMFMIIFAYAQYYNKPGRTFGEFFGYWWLILLHIGYMCYIQFSRKFLDTTNKDKTIDRLFRFEIAALLVLMLAYSFVHFFTKEVKWDYYLETIMKITVVGISIIYVIMGLKNKDRLMLHNHDSLMVTITGTSASGNCITRLPAPTLPITWLLIVGLVLKSRNILPKPTSAITTFERARLSWRALSEPISTFTKKVSISTLFSTPVL